MVKTELSKIIGAQWEPKGTFFIVAGNLDTVLENALEKHKT